MSFIIFSFSLIIFGAVAILVGVVFEVIDIVEKRISKSLKRKAMESHSGWS